MLGLWLCLIVCLFGWLAVSLFVCLLLMLMCCRGFVSCCFVGLLKYDVVLYVFVCACWCCCYIVFVDVIVCCCVAMYCLLLVVCCVCD